MNKNTNAALCRNWAVNPVPTADRMDEPDCIQQCIYKLRMHKICIYL